MLRFYLESEDSHKFFTLFNLYYKAENALPYGRIINNPYKHLSKNGNLSVSKSYSLMSLKIKKIMFL